MTKAIQNQYLNYADKVLAAIEIALDQSKISDVDATALMIEFSNCKTVEELKRRVEELQNLYPILKEASFREQQEVAENFEDVVQKYVTYLIQNGRALEVVELTKATKSMNRSIDTLKSKYPEIKNLI